MIPHVTEEKKFTVPVTATEFNLPEDKVSVDIFLEVFDKVEEIANSPKSKTTAASSNERMRTLRSSHLINLGLQHFTFEIKIFFSASERPTCVISPASTPDQQRWIFKYVEVKKKIISSRKVKVFTKAVNTDITIGEKGLKKKQIHRISTPYP